ncbi:hypothetical protein BH23CHL2_BH23CHL2_01420 [soil metagenome]
MNSTVIATSRVNRTKGKGISMKRLKGRVVQMALWLATIMAIVLASGAPNRL